MIIDIPYRCPACGERSLHVYSNTGQFACLEPGCPDRHALNKILQNDLGPTKHVVQIDDERWSAEHPLVERVDDGIHRCGIIGAIETMRECAVPPGKYTVMITRDGDRLDYNWVLGDEREVD